MTDQQGKGSGSLAVTDALSRRPGVGRDESAVHPSRSLVVRNRGYGIGSGYERPYVKKQAPGLNDTLEIYAPLSHSGYFGSGSAQRPFGHGEARFGEELELYHAQFGEVTSVGVDGRKKA
jgi:hypothetical protein